MTNLNTLYISNNQLREIPPQISQLTQLVNLSMHTNQLELLPASMRVLTRLDVLYLNNNNLPAGLQQNNFGKGSALLQDVVRHFEELEKMAKNAIYAWLLVCKKGEIQLPAKAVKQIVEMVWRMRHAWSEDEKEERHEKRQKTKE